jgi:hypothetical protein
MISGIPSFEADEVALLVSAVQKRAAYGLKCGAFRTVLTFAAALRRGREVQASR